MNIQTKIQHRRSVRTYTGEPLKTEHIFAIKHFIAELRPLYDAKVRIEMLGVLDSNSPVKLGTYEKIAATADIYALPLSMVRLAPSGHNRQEWRVVKENDVLHFYKTPSPTASIDTGIALCHFVETCKELNINGNLVFLSKKSENGLQYVVSWVKKLSEPRF
ncbi:hypothetical protein AGMMS4957_22460 [Bacteroidia bacterium]|nr:hypothetical protein AGMMS4957_22460 [Bacteroidia bacterium]